MSLLPPGAGKTVIGLDTAHAWPGDGPVIINSTKNGLGTWVNQLAEWYPEEADEIQVVSGDKFTRAALWNRERRYYVCTYDTIRLDMATKPPNFYRRFRGVIGDECHKRRNHKNTTSKAYRHVTRYIPNLLLTTGSHMMRGPMDLFALFQLINPKVFSSYWRFANTFCVIEEGYFGKEIGQPKNKEALVDLILRYGYYKSREDLKGQLPDKNRMASDLRMTSQQQEIYESLVEECIAWINDSSIIVAPTKLTQILRIRQLLVCPKILDPALGMGAGFEDLLDKLEEQPHAHIVTPFKEAIPHIITALNAEGYKDVDFIQGGMRAGLAQEKADAACKNGGIIISSLQAAESYSLSTMKMAYFLGYDYTPDQNYQAEDRIVRADSTMDPVNIYYARYRGTLDDEALAVVNEKQVKISQINNLLELKTRLQKRNS